MNGRNSANRRDFLGTGFPQAAAPPWGSNLSWQAANRSFDIHIDRYRVELGPAMTIAQEIRCRLALIFPLLNGLCLSTCRHCPEPCCQTASPWYDFRDLLFLHLNFLEIPRFQPIHLHLVSLSYPNGEFKTKKAATAGDAQSNVYRN